MKILYGVSSVGLGHVRRSIAIAKRLMELGDFEIEWVCSEPALTFLSEQNFKVLQISRELKSLSPAMEEHVSFGRLDDISSVARASSRIARQNFYSIRALLQDYDALIQDEFAETMFHFMWGSKAKLPTKRVIITDYLRFETSSKNLLNRIVIWYANRMLAKSYNDSGLCIFADDKESVPSKIVRRMKTFAIVGPIVDVEPGESREELRRKLFPSLRNEKLILISIGGTGIGKYLFDFVISNSKSILDRLPCCAIALLLGPSILRSSYSTVDSAERIYFVPFTTDAMAYFKAADCVVTQAGGSTLNEVASLGIPCVAIPIKNHWEQQANAERFAKNYGFKVIQYDELETGFFVDTITRAMGSKYEPCGFSDGARNAASLILEYLKS